MPSSSEGSGHAGRVTLPWDPRFCLTSLGGADGDGTPSLLFGRAGARPSLGFGPVAGARCRPPLCVSFSLLLVGSFRLVQIILKLPKWIILYHKPDCACASVQKTLLRRLGGFGSAATGAFQVCRQNVLAITKKQIEQQIECSQSYRRAFNLSLRNHLSPSGIGRGEF